MKRQNENRNTQCFYNELLDFVFGTIGVLCVFCIWMSANKWYTVFFTVAAIVAFGIWIARCYNRAEHKAQKTQDKEQKNKVAPVAATTVVEQEIKGRVRQRIIIESNEKKPYDWAAEERPKKKPYDWEEDEAKESESSTEQVDDDKVVYISKARIKQQIKKAKEKREQQ